jgi:hypothetical protein
VQKANFRAVLDARQDSSDTAIGLTTTWNVLEPSVSDELGYKVCPPAARLRVWFDFLTELLSKERESWAEEDAARFRKERKSACCLFTTMHVCTISIASVLSLISVKLVLKVAVSGRLILLGFARN